VTIRVQGDSVIENMGKTGGKNGDTESDIRR
jgi:hypothetical protein